MMSKRMDVIVLLISVLANIGLAYRVLDLGKTITDGSDEIARRDKQVYVVQNVFPSMLKDKSRSNLVDTGQNLGLEVIDKGDEGVYVGGVQFIFSGDRVSEVLFN